MVQWQDLPILPELGGMTGQTIKTEDQVLMTFCTRDGVYLATSSDPMLLNWERNLILASDGPLKAFQMPIDTDIWQEDGVWYIILRKHWWDEGLWHLRGSKPALGLFRSENLKDWEPAGTFFEEEAFTQPGDDFACPNFVPIGQDKHLLLFYCHPRGSMYFVGDYDTQNQRFNPEQYGRVSYGPTKRGSLHAPSAFADSRGQCFAIFNVTENREHERGWIGVMSLPRKLSLSKAYFNPISTKGWFGQAGRLDPVNLPVIMNPIRIEPVTGLESLRFNPTEIEGLDITANSELMIPGMKGKAIEMQAIIDPMKAREVGFHVLRSPDGEEKTTIRLYMHGWERVSTSRQLSIDVSSASLDSSVKSRSPEMGPLYLAEGEPLRLSVYIDRSIIEVFANERQCLTIRTYPSREDSNGISVYSRGSEARLISLRTWQMRSIWPELKHWEGK
jgi:beta-fructofuranosidase